MSMEAAALPDPLHPLEQIRYARQIVQSERDALDKLAGRLGDDFCRAADTIYGCSGSVIVSGMGKAGLIGQKIMATLASTGTPSHYLHPAEAVHGDLGRVHRDDVLLVLSQSGETEEVVRLLPSLATLGAKRIAITARRESTLGRAADITIELGALEEACRLGLAPSTSTTVMLAVGDALALVVSRMRGFTREDFAQFHPAGSLGLQLSRVEDHMRPKRHCRVASQDMTVRQMLITVAVPGRRTGATMLVDPQGKLTGLFTDSDLARLFEHRRDSDLDCPVSQVMTPDPVSVSVGSMMTESVAVMAERKISELPVVGDRGQPVGLIDITDVVSLFPKEMAQSGLASPRTADESSCRIFPEPPDCASA